MKNLSRTYKISSGSIYESAHLQPCQSSQNELETGHGKTQGNQSSPGAEARESGTKGHF